MAQGLKIAVITLCSYLFLLVLVYIFELYVFDLSEFGEHEENLASKQSKQNIWIAIVILFLGTIFYVFDI